MKKKILLGMVRLVQKLGVSGVRSLACFIGTVMWFALVSRRKATIKRIVERLEVSEQRARAIARSSFGHTAQSFLDILIAGKIGTPELPLTDGWQTGLERIKNTGRPIVFFTAHFGPWEAGASLAGKTLRSRALSVVRKQRDGAGNEVIRLLRREYCLETVDHREVANIVTAHLRGNGIACFAVDHNSPRKDSLFIPFLGKTAAVTMGPAILAVRTKAILEGSFIQRESDGSNRVFFIEPLDTALLQGTLREKIQTVAEYYTTAVEKQVRSCPEQWFWIHDRWKTRPEDEEIV